jgi:hypothetical protein
VSNATISSTAMPSCRDFFVDCAMPAQPTSKSQNRQALFSNQPSGRAAHYSNAAPASASRHFAEGIPYVGSLLLSVLETCKVNGVNAWEYLLAVYRNARAVRAKPFDWTPWRWAEL